MSRDSGAPVPVDTEAEESVIGAMLLSRDAIDVVSRHLTVGDFYRPALGFVFHALVRLQGRGEPCDAVSCAAELDAMGVDKTIITIPDLISLQSNTPSISAAERYAKIVSERSMRRLMVDRAYELIFNANDLTIPATETFDGHLAQLAMIEAGILGGDVDETIAIEDFINRDQSVVSAWTIHALIRNKHKMLIVGGEGSGKSSIMRYAGICAAYGIEPFRHRRTKPIRVLICDFENPEDALFDSFTSIIKNVNRESDWEEPEDRLWWRPEGINLRERADLIHLENQIRLRRPDLVCMGPLYEMYQNNPKDSWETAAKDVQGKLKKLMYRYNFALIIEDHAPNDRSAGMRPYGSSFWRRWPDIGLGLEPMMLPDQVRGEPPQFYEDRFRLNRWRGQRVPTDWPKYIIRGESISSPWYFQGDWNNGDFDLEGIRRGSKQRTNYEDDNRAGRD